LADSLIGHAIARGHFVAPVGRQPVELLAQLRQPAFRNHGFVHLDLPSVE
jgi:hypothetical protein